MAVRRRMKPSNLLKDPGIADRYHPWRPNNICACGFLCRTRFAVFRILCWKTGFVEDRRTVVNVRSVSLRTANHTRKWLEEEIEGIGKDLNVDLFGEDVEVDGSDESTGFQLTKGSKRTR